MCLSKLLDFLRPPLPGKGLAMATVDWAYLVERVVNFYRVFWYQVDSLAVLVARVTRE